MHLFSDCFTCDHTFAEAADEFAPAGPDGARAASLLAEAKRDGAEVFAAACESAVNRLLANPNPLEQGVLFDDEELADIADALSRGIATADLLGRTRVRRRAEMAQRAEAFAEECRLLVDDFAWDDWKQGEGGKWKSPGGRVLSDPAYQKMKGRSKGKPAAAETVAARASGEPAGAAQSQRTPQPGKVYQLDPAKVAVDPQRFQFKLNTDATTGTTKELTGVEKFDPELAGVVAVWKDPADGKTYVVNGHHRLELAKRTGTKGIAVRYLNAKTAEEARAKGALINIAEGRGTAVDAAKFLRDTGRTPADLAAVGVSLSGSVARDAVELAKLSPVLFRRVAFGAVEPERAIAVAKNLPNHSDQERLIQAVEKQDERTGRPVPPKVVEAMAKEFAAAPKLTKVQETLFGPMEEDDTVYFHRAELKSFVRGELAKEARDFRLGASARRAEALGTVAGNKLDTGTNRTIAEKADVALATFDGQAQLKGPLSDLLNQFAVEYANASGTGRAELRRRALGAVRQLLSGAQPDGPGRVQSRGPSLFD